MNQKEAIKRDPMHALAAGIVRFRFVIILLFLLAAVYCALSLSRVKINSDLTAFLSPATETRQGLTVMEEEFLTYASENIMISNVTYQRAGELKAQIEETALAIGIGVVDHTTIDRINILNATKMAMKMAVRNLKIVPDLVMIDAVHIDDLDLPQMSIIKGDAKSVSIAAASIVAKETRDRMMEEYDKLYPGYGFAQNKGYGTKEHMEALKKLGPCPIHRSSFIHL